MPVEANINNLSSIPEQNTPLGTEPANRVDDYLRQASAHIATLRTRLITVTAGGADRGDWQASTAYAPNDVTWVGNIGYQAALDHTSAATFAADLAAGKWAVFQGLTRAELADTDIVDLSLTDYTALRAYSGNKTRVYITGVLGTVAAPGISGVFVRHTGDTTSADNGGTIIRDALGRRWRRVFDDAVRVKWFGAVGDGVTDDTQAFVNFFQAIQGRIGLLGPNTYYIATRIQSGFTNCLLAGVPGKTKLTSSYRNPTNPEQAGFIRLLDIDNFHVYGIEFESTLVSATLDSGSALVFSYQNNVKNSSFRNCKFTAPLANASGLSFYTRITAGDTGATIDGLVIEDNDFVDLGAIGSTIMNRGAGADKYQAARRVRFNNNNAYNLGTQGSFGFLVSLDGFGSDTEVNGNNLRKCLGIGIENTGWIDSRFIGNVFSDFSRSYAPMSWSGNSMTGCRIEGNICQEDALVTTNFINVNNCVFEGNVWRATSASNNAAVSVTGSSNTFTSDTYVSGSFYAALVKSTTVKAELNIFDKCTFDTSSSLTNYSAVTFDGALCKNNTVKSSKILKGAGGFVAAQQASASENVIIDYCTSEINIAHGYRVVTLPDADSALAGLDAMISYDAVRFIGSLTAGRNITIPRAWMVKPKRVRNTTGQTLTFILGGVTGDALASGAVGTMVYDASLGSVRIF